MSDSKTLPSLPPTNIPPGKQRIPVIRSIYFFYFAAFGITTTFLNIYYNDIGLTGVQIGVISSVLPLISIIAAPLWGVLSDRLGRNRTLLGIASVGIILSMSGIWLMHTFFLIIIFTGLYAFFDSSVLTIIDSTALRSLGQNRDRFGRERVWGSVGFIIAAWGVGYILERFGVEWFFLFFILMIVGVLVALYWLPDQKTELQAFNIGEIKKFITQKQWLIFSASLLMIGLGSFAINGFLGIYITDLGGSEGLVGMAAAFATITELPILFWGDKILKRFKPRQLLMVAFGATGLRLLLYSIMPDASWVLPISLTHSLTFGVYWIATIAYVDQLSADEIKSSAQGILYAVLNVSRMISAIICGYFYDLVGGSQLFLISAVFSLAAIFLLSLNRPKAPTKLLE